LLAIVLSMLIFAVAKADGAKDEDKLQGSWKVVSHEKDGKKQAEDTIKNYKIVVKGDKLTFKIGDQDNEATLKLDAAKKPKTIDLMVKAGDKMEVIKGIYQLDGDDLKICAAGEEGVERPKDFATKAKSGLGLLVLKREKP